MTTYLLNDISYLPSDTVLQYNGNQKFDQEQSAMDHKTIDQSELINNVDQTTDIMNIDTSTITVLRPHQTDMGEQVFNTFSYNFIL